MAKIDSYRELEVWQLAMVLVLDVYRVTRTFPPEERFGLAQQARRSAVSVPSNIAEGHNRHAQRAYLNHVNIALGSLAELETEIEVAVRLTYVTTDQVGDFSVNADSVGRMLRRLQQRLEAGLLTAKPMFALLCVLASPLLML
jgi:four helix bundle protein